MSDINAEMRESANHAIKLAREEFFKKLDYSENSLAILDNILEKIHEWFSSRTDDILKSGLILETANIWGSYIGEYMRLKWGGNWIIKGPDRLVSIFNVEFSPISVVYQKITSRPVLSIEGYLLEVNRIMYRLTIDPTQAEYLSKNLSQYEGLIHILPIKNPSKVNKHVLLSILGIIAMLLVIGACIVGFTNISARGIPAFSIFTSTKSTGTKTPQDNALLTSTSTSTKTQDPTQTTLPTYTPKPSNTLVPSRTPTPNWTQTATITLSVSSTPSVTPSPTARRSPTSYPTKTRIPPTLPPSPSATRISSPTATVLPHTATVSPPTATQIPPVVIESCEIDPSIVPAGLTSQITFSAHFSAPGYGFSTSFQSEYPGQVDCSGTDTNGDGTASCVGLSGMLPSKTTVDVVFSSPFGDCTASYQSP